MLLISTTNVLCLWCCVYVCPVVGGVGGLLTTHCCHLLLAGVHSGHSLWPPDLRWTPAPAQAFIPSTWTSNDYGNMDFLVRRKTQNKIFILATVMTFYNSGFCFACLYSVTLWLCRLQAPCCFEWLLWINNCDSKTLDILVCDVFMDVGAVSLCGQSLRVRKVSPQ